MYIRINLIMSIQYNNISISCKQLKMIVNLLAIEYKNPTPQVKVTNFIATVQRIEKSYCCNLLQQINVHNKG